MIKGLFSLFVFAAIGTGCAATTSDEGSATDNEETVGTSSEALTSCRCHGGLCNNCQISTRNLVGPCTCPGGAVACTISTNYTPVNVDSNVYRWSEMTPFSGGGDVKICTRKETIHSVTALMVQTICWNHALQEQTSVATNKMVHKSHGSVAGTFGNSGTCGLFESWGPWSGWQSGY